MRWIFILLMGLNGAGCATGPWRAVLPTDNVRVLSEAGQLRLPSGWVEQVVPAVFPRVDVTRDGPGLQWMAFEFRPKQDALQSLGVSWNKAPSLWLIAEWERALSLRELNAPGAKVTSYNVVTFLGSPAIQLDIDFIVPPGTHYRRRVYALINEQGWMRAWLQAPQHYYFDDALPTFEAAVASWRLE